MSDNKVQEHLNARLHKIWERKGFVPFTQPHELFDDIFGSVWANTVHEIVDQILQKVKKAANKGDHNIFFVLPVQQKIDLLMAESILKQMGYHTSLEEVVFASAPDRLLGSAIKVSWEHFLMESAESYDKRKKSTPLNIIAASLLQGHAQEALEANQHLTHRKIGVVSSNYTTVIKQVDNIAARMINGFDEFEKSESKSLKQMAKDLFEITSKYQLLSASDMANIIQQNGQHLCIKQAGIGYASDQPGLEGGQDAQKDQVVIDQNEAIGAGYMVYAMNLLGDLLAKDLKKHPEKYSDEIEDIKHCAGRFAAIRLLRDKKTSEETPKT